MNSALLAAAIGAGAAILGVVITQVAVVYTQHVRTLRLALLDRRLKEVYAPLDYWLAVLLATDLTEAGVDHARDEMRMIMRTNGYLMSAAVRADVYRLLTAGHSAESVAGTYLAFRQEYEQLIQEFSRYHFSRLTEKPLLK